MRKLYSINRKTMAAGQEEPEHSNGFRLLPRTDEVITSELVEQWLEEDAAEQAIWENSVLVLPGCGGGATPNVVERLVDNDPNS